MSECRAAIREQATTLPDSGAPTANVTTDRRILSSGKNIVVQNLYEEKIKAAKLELLKEKTYFLLKSSKNQEILFYLLT